MLTNVAIIAVISIILSIFNVGAYVTPYGLNYQALLIFAAIVGFTGSLISLTISKWMAKKAYNIHIIEQPRNAEEEFLLNTVQHLAEQAKIGMPELGIYESPEANAFATGMRKNKALVAVSTGLLDHMEKDEIEGVLAHEVAHIANGDMITMALVQGVINTFVIFFARIAAYAVQTFLSKDRGGEAIGGFAYYAIAWVFEILFGILASTIVFAFSRYREFRADKGSSELLGTNTKMIKALQKLEKLADAMKHEQRGKSFATMKISDNPSVLGKLFSSHPPIQKRIEALQNR